MTSQLIRKGGEQFFDDNGEVLANGKLEYRYALTDLAYPVFRDSALSVPWPAHVPLDANGRLDDPVYGGEDAYREILYRGDDTQVFSEDDYPGAPPAQPGDVLTDVQTFTATGSWTKPAGCHFVHVELIGSGAGGGSGRKGAANSNRCGGGGGEGGERVSMLFRAADLGATETVTIGVPGVGGAPQTLNSTNGNDGTAGGDTTFGTHLRARGGQPGKGGTATDGFGGGSRTGNALSGEGGSAHPTAGTPEAPAQSLRGAGGGGPGGGISAGNVLGVAAAGAAGSADNPSAPPGGAAGAGDGDSGANGTSIVALRAYGGPGGGGGRAGLANPGGAGGNGGTRGGGGGGGGAGTDSVGNSGKGGDGAPGVAIVRSW